MTKLVCQDDIALLVCMVVLIGLTVFVVAFKVFRNSLYIQINGIEIQVAFVDEKPDPSISTFRPLDQHVKLFQIIDAKMCVVFPLKNISDWSNLQRWEAVKCTMGTVIWAAMDMFPAK